MQTSSHSDVQTRSHSDDQADLEGYRQLSTLAIVSLVLGLLSPVALFGGVLFVAPLLAIVLGFSALGWIGALPEARSGRSLALWGVGLAVGCLSMAIVKPLAITQILIGQSRPTAEVWLEQLRTGNLTAAEAITTKPGKSRPTLYEPQNKPPTFLERFPDIVKLQSLDDWQGVKFLRSSYPVKAPRGDWLIELVYRLESKGSSDGRQLTLLLKRLHNKAGVSPWLVSRLALLESKN